MTIKIGTSFFVSLYVKDAHSTDANRLLGSGPAPWISPLHFAEWTHAVAAQVFRGYMTIVETAQAQHKLEDDQDAGLWVNIDIPYTALKVCAELGRPL